MPFFSKYKSTVFYLSVCLIACGQQQNKLQKQHSKPESFEHAKVIVAANRTEQYFPLLKDKKVAVVANQTSVIFKKTGYVHLVDSLVQHGFSVQKVFAPEHGFRGKADAGASARQPGGALAAAHRGGRRGSARTD